MKKQLVCAGCFFVIGVCFGFVVMKFVRSGRSVFHRKRALAP